MPLNGWKGHRMGTDNHAGNETIRDPDAVDPVVLEILTAMPLKEKVAIANLDESDVAYRDSSS